MVVFRFNFKGGQAMVLTNFPAINNSLAKGGRLPLLPIAVYAHDSVQSIKIMQGSLAEN